MEYKGILGSPSINGDVKLTIGENELYIESVLDSTTLSYAQMFSIGIVDYAVLIRTYYGDYSFSRMGQWCEPFCKAVLDAYNKKVLKSLFISGTPSLTAKGDYSYDEDGESKFGKAEIFVYDNCLCLLTPDINARRIPLCFITEIDSKDFEITFKIDEQKYTVARIGYDTEPFQKAVSDNIMKLREKSYNALQEMDPSLSGPQYSAVAKIIPEGAAVKVEKIEELAPSLVLALEEKISSGRAAKTYKVFCDISDKSQIYIGFKKNTGDTGSLIPDLSNFAEGSENPLGIIANADNAESESVVDPYTLWFIVPSKDGKSCAVEFAGEQETSAATFIYRFNTDFDTFARKLNYALEAIDFKREVIRLGDDELRKPEHADYLMAFQRNKSLQFIRSCFVGRAIHRSVDSWKNSILEYFGEI